MTRELIILAADGTMATVLRAFFERPFHHALKCAPFDFDPSKDIVNDPLNTDGSIHRNCHDILRDFLKTYRRALRHNGPSLRQLLAQDGRWPPGAAKPPAPKEVIQEMIRTNRAGPPMVVYSQIARAVSTKDVPASQQVGDRE